MRYVWLRTPQIAMSVIHAERPSAGKTAQDSSAQDSSAEGSNTQDSSTQNRSSEYFSPRDTSAENRSSQDRSAQSGCDTEAQERRNQRAGTASHRTADDAGGRAAGVASGGSAAGRGGLQGEVQTRAGGLICRSSPVFRPEVGQGFGCLLSRVRADLICGFIRSSQAELLSPSRAFFRVGSRGQAVGRRKSPSRAILVLRQAMPSLKMAVEGLSSPTTVQANHVLSRCRPGDWHGWGWRGWSSERCERLIDGVDDNG